MKLAGLMLLMKTTATTYLCWNSWTVVWCL